MKLKYFFLLFIAFFMTLLLFGCDPSSIGSDDYGTVKVEGFVMDVSNQIGIDNATILTAQSQDSSYSDKGGNFFIVNFRLAQNPQEVDIIAEKVGYKTAQLKITLTAGETAHVTIPMTPK
jgi:hypothetical protein